MENPGDHALVHEAVGALALVDRARAAERHPHAEVRRILGGHGAPACAAAAANADVESVGRVRSGVTPVGERYAMRRRGEARARAPVEKVVRSFASELAVRRRELDLDAMIGTDTGRMSRRSRHPRRAQGGAR